MKNRLILIKVTKVIQRSQGFFFCCLINIKNTVGILGCCHFKSCKDPYWYTYVSDLCACSVWINFSFASSWAWIFQLV